MNERRKALQEAAEYAEFYADERMRLCGDSIIHDPIFAGERTPEAFERSESMRLDGTINSASYHAAKHIADHLRKMANEA